MNYTGEVFLSFLLVALKVNEYLIQHGTKSAALSDCVSFSKILKSIDFEMIS